MLILKLFGTASIEASSGPVPGRAAQGRRLALLASLALARGRPITRDKLTALLWPESPTDRARHQLSDALYIVRAALGEDVIRSASDELVLNPDVIASDAGTFERLLDEGRLEPAVELFGGPLLDGFHLSDAAEFERWLDAERARLGQRYAAALASLAEASEGRDQFAAAVGWWRRLAAHDPYNGRVVLRLMRSLEAAGDRAGALQHARVHAALLREEFDAAPDPEVTAFAERLRLEPPARSAPEPVAARPAYPSLAAAVEDSTGRRRGWRGAAALLAGLFFVGAVWALWPRDAEPERSIVVLPFMNMSPDGRNEYFSDGLTEEIIRRLSAVPELKVISRTSAMHYKGSKKSLRQIAAELNVAHVLEGGVRQIDGRVRVSAQLVDARADEHVWAKNYDFELRDIFRVQGEIAWEVARGLDVELGEQGRRLLVKQGTRDPEAYQFYRRGRFLWNTRTKEGHEQAVEYYRRAIERDSGYADAYAGLADAYLTASQLNLARIPETETYSRIKWAAERALALDDKSADAHTSFAVTLWWQRNWPGAERELRRAIELNPGHATAHTWYSQLLGGMARLEEGRQESRRAYELDPFAVVVSINVAWQCYLARDYDCAVEQYRRTLEISTAWPFAYAGLGVVYAQKGMRDEALRAVRRAAELRPQHTVFSRISLTSRRWRAKRRMRWRISNGRSSSRSKDSTSRARTWPLASRTARSPGSGAAAGNGRTGPSEPTPRSIPCAPIHASRNWWCGWIGRWGCNSLQLAGTVRGSFGQFIRRRMCGPSLGAAEKRHIPVFAAEGSAPRDDIRAYSATYAAAPGAYAGLVRGARGRLAEFESTLARLPALVPIGGIGWINEQPQQYLRYRVAKLLFDDGRTRDAERYFRSFQPYDYFYTTQAELYLGRIAEARGRPEEAVTHFGKFVRWWRYADEPLRPLWDGLARR